MTRFRILVAFLVRELHPHAICVRALVELLWRVHDAAVSDQYDRETRNHNPWGASYMHSDPATFEQ